MSNFKKQFLQNKVTYEDILKFVTKWHKSTTTMELPEFLGLTEEEYTLFLQGDDSLKKQLEREKLSAVSHLKKEKVILALRKIVDGPCTTKAAKRK